MREDARLPQELPNRYRRSKKAVPHSILPGTLTERLKGLCRHCVNGGTFPACSVSVISRRYNFSASHWFSAYANAFDSSECRDSVFCFSRSQPSSAVSSGTAFPAEWPAVPPRFCPGCPPRCHTARRYGTALRSWCQRASARARPPATPR